MKYLITGSAGFIGYHLVKRLCGEGKSVIGIDNINDYYDPKLKTDRLSSLENLDNFEFQKLDLLDAAKIKKIFKQNKIEKVIHLAAQAGVRYSLKNPHTYISSNIEGFLNILECCRHNAVEHLVYASSSSVYGLNKEFPFSVKHSTNHPASLYAATKKSNELMAHSYSHLYNIPTTGLRFFTVYGPWGRPDMALYIFTEKLTSGKTIDVNNNGEMSRDFTYVDDIIEGVTRIKDIIPTPIENSISSHLEADSSSAPYSIYNIGAGNPVKLTRFIEILEESLDLKADLNFRKMQPGDVKSTHADISELFEAVNYKPKISIEVGIKKFIEWYMDYYY
ncbi:MAG: protein CapI [Candidatus Marinimicrobia bacterium]|nr:protein CapI [Candidatus Neomarinimicrobiota bacterium]|tara:strand:+ start:590 stop:1594 length:1005 start_codon:yes stop_codon:yes gene_type:complete